MVTYHDSSPLSESPPPLPMKKHHRRKQVKGMATWCTGTGSRASLRGCVACRLCHTVCVWGRRQLQSEGADVSLSTPLQNFRTLEERRWGVKEAGPVLSDTVPRRRVQPMASPTFCSSTLGRSTTPKVSGRGHGHTGPFLGGSFCSVGLESGCGRLALPSRVSLGPLSMLQAEDDPAERMDMKMHPGGLGPQPTPDCPDMLL